MPHYFIDTDDGETAILDRIGLELDNIERARAEAVRALPEIARDIAPDGEERVISASVRGDDGRLLFRASLTLSCERLD